MGLFEEIKQNITVRQAAEMYGFKPNRSGLIRCIFHNDKTPSMKVDRRYYCFGCGCTGDAIDFTAQLFGLSLKDAAIKLAEDFGIRYANRPRVSWQIQKKPTPSPEQKWKADYIRCLRAYLDYHAMLKEWKEKYAPKTQREELDERFVWALQNLDSVEYYLDILLFGESEDIEKLVQEIEEEVEKIECRCDEYYNRRTEKYTSKNGENGRQESSQNSQRVFGTNGERNYQRNNAELHDSSPRRPAPCRELAI